MKQEVEKWRPFGHPDGDIRDLSFLDAHQAVYVQHHEGKEPLEYRFWVTYSLHCSTGDGFRLCITEFLRKAGRNEEEAFRPGQHSC